jgi:hypothetical protein
MEAAKRAKSRSAVSAWLYTEDKQRSNNALPNGTREKIGEAKEVVMREETLVHQ